MRAEHRLITALMAAALVVGCGDSGPVTGGTDAIVSVELLPDSVVLAPGDTRQFIINARNDSNDLVTAPNVAWRVSNTALATVSGTGLVRALSAGSTWVVASASGHSDSSRVRVTAPVSGGGTIHVNAAVERQTMLGWEATSQAGQVMCQGFDVYDNALFDRAVNELGLNRVRLEVRSGSENPEDVFARFRAGQATYDQWRASWYASVNDNGDPNSINPAGFHFTELDHTIQTFVLPMKQRVEANGERLYINLNFVDFIGSAWDHKNYPAEYAEFMLATFQHIQSRYGWVPDAVEVILEPDVADWTPAQVAQAMAAAGSRLSAAGFHPDFIGPSTTAMGAAITYVDAILAVSANRSLLKEISYHRYSGESVANLQALAQRALQYGLQTSMLEKIGVDYNTLHEDIKVGLNSSWSQYALAFCQDTDRGGLYYLVNTSNPASPQVTMASRTRYLRQYFRFVRSGAVRVDAASTDGSLDPLAFINTDGKNVVVVKAGSGRSFTVSGLPAGTYGIRYTTSSADFQAAPDVAVAAGGLLATSIPAAGVLTIHRK